MLSVIGVSWLGNLMPNLTLGKLAKKVIVINFEIDRCNMLSHGSALSKEGVQLRKLHLLPPEYDSGHRQRIIRAMRDADGQC